MFKVSILLLSLFVSSLSGADDSCEGDWVFTTPLCNYGQCGLEIDVAPSKQCLAKSFKRCQHKSFGEKITVLKDSGSIVSGFRKSGKYSYKGLGGENGWCHQVADQYIGKPLNYSLSQNSNRKTFVQKVVSKEEVKKTLFEGTYYQYTCQVQLVKASPVSKRSAVCGVLKRKDCLSISPLNCTGSACKVSLEAPTLKVQMLAAFKTKNPEHQFRIPGFYPKAALLNNKHIRIYSHTLRCESK